MNPLRMDNVICLGNSYFDAKDVVENGNYYERAGSKKDAYYDEIMELDRIVSLKLLEKSIAYFMSAIITLALLQWFPVVLILVILGGIYLGRYLYSVSDKERIFTSRVSVTGIDNIEKNDMSLVEFSDGSLEYLPRGFARYGECLHFCVKGSKIYCIK